jgi:hypothetical protein
VRNERQQSGIGEWRCRIGWLPWQWRVRSQRCRLAALAWWAVATGILSATPLLADGFDWFETWDASGTGAWTNGATGVTVLSNPGGRLNIQYPAQALPTYARDIIRMPIPSGVRVTNVTFSLRAERMSPSALEMVLHARHSGRLWLAVLSTPTVGQLQVFSRRTTPDDGWTQGVGCNAAWLERDGQDLDYVGIRLTRHGDTCSQDFAIDDFRVRGTWAWRDEDGDGMDDAWEARYGLDASSAVDGAEDADGDGMSNYSEFRAGTDPLNAQSQFGLQVESARLVGGGVLLGWESIPERWYTISRSVGGVRAMSGLASEIPAQGSWTTYLDRSATNAGPYFYRVAVEP